MCNLSGTNRSNLLCGICIITFLLGLGVTLIILGETLDIIDSTILGAIFLVFGAFVSSCIIAMIVRPLYHKRRIGYSSSDLRPDSLVRQESKPFSEHGGSIYIHDSYAAGADRPKTVSSVHVDIIAAEKRSGLFSAKSGNQSLSSSQASFMTALDSKRNSVLSEDDRSKSVEELNSSTEKINHKVSFEDNAQDTKF